MQERLVEAPSRFWFALEQVPGLSAVGREWQTLAGSKFQALEHYLRPTNKVASAVPCPMPHPGCGCAHDVVAHTPDDIVAVCRCEPRRCDTVPLAAQDIVIREINIETISRAICRSMALRPNLDPVAALHHTWRIANWRTPFGSRVPVYLSVQIEAEAFSHVVSELCVFENGPLIVLAPTDELCRPEHAATLRAAGGMFVPLADFLSVDSGGHFEAAAPIGEHFVAALRGGSPKSKSSRPDHDGFPTPPETTWGDIIIQFVDGHTVRITAKGVRRRINYSDMGMGDGRNAEPNLQWKLLEQFAQQRGELDWSGRDADRRLKKRCQLLSDALIAFFGLTERPLQYAQEIKGWRTLFTIIPESD